MSDDAEKPEPPIAEPPLPEPRIPPGCHPLVFGVVMATLEMAAILLLWRGCR